MKYIFYAWLVVAGWTIRDFQDGRVNIPNEKGKAQLSKYNKCHDVYSPWFGRMKYFTSYKTMDECLATGAIKAY